MAKIIIKDGQIVSQDGTQLKFENTPISGTTAEFTSITAQNLYGNGSNLNNVVKTTNENQTIDGTKTFSNSIKLYSFLYNLGGTGTNPQYNVSIGRSAGYNITTGTNNVSLGTQALYENETGTQNIAIGNSSLQNPVASSYNTGVGPGTLMNVLGNQNIGIGYFALTNIVGNSNVAIGESAGSSVTAGHNNIFLGPYAGKDETSLSETTIIRNGSADGKERLRIDSSGNVSINSTSATVSGTTYRLYVNGSFRSTSIKSAEATFDYSFSEQLEVGNEGLYSAGTIHSEGGIQTNSGFDGDGTYVTNVNAALLNSQPGSYYLNYNNFTNKPTIGDATITLSAGDGLQTGGDFTTNQTTSETITLAVNNTVVRTTDIDQSIDGTKTFLNDIIVNGLTVGKGNDSLAQNTAFGVNALQNAVSVTPGGGDVIPGTGDGNFNVAIGFEALQANTNGANNVAIGYQALKTIQQAQSNVSVGYQSGVSLSSGNLNTFLGFYSGAALTSGAGNLFLGNYTGQDFITGNNNIFIGSNAAPGNGITTISDTTIISNGVGKERLRIDSSGNVSINSTSAVVDGQTFKLHVNGDFRANYIYSPNVGFDEAYINSLIIYNSIDLNGNGISAGTVEASTGFIGDGSGLINVVKTFGDQTIDGIKTFNNNINFASTAAGLYFPGPQNNSTLIRVNTVNNDLTLLRAALNGAADIGSYGFSIKYIGSGNGNNNTLSIFSDNQAATTQIEALTILQDGFIGLNRTNPEARLDVNGNGIIRGQLFSGNTTQTTWLLQKYNDAYTGLYSAAYNQISLRSGNVDRLHIDTSGNVSINTTSSNGYKLYVLGTFAATGQAIVDELQVDNDATIIGTVSAGYFYGDGSQLYGVSGIDDILAGDGLAQEVLNEQKTLSVDSSVIRNTGNQTIGGIKTFQKSAITSPNTSFEPGTISVFENNSHSYITFLNPSTTKAGLLFKNSANATYYSGAILYDNSTNALDFRTNALTSPRMYIDSSGKVGIGTTSPGEMLEIYGSHPFIKINNTQETEGGILFVDSAAESQYGKVVFNSGSPNELRFYVNNTTTSKMSLTSSGNLTVSGTITELSTRKVKKNIRSLGSQLNKIKKLNPVSYRRKEVKDSKKEVGFISEEVKEVYPELVTGEGVNYSKMVSILVSAVKELTEKVEQQEKEIENLKRIAR